MLTTSPLGTCLFLDFYGKSNASVLTFASPLLLSSLGTCPARCVALRVSWLTCCPGWQSRQQTGRQQQQQERPHSRHCCRTQGEGTSGTSSRQVRCVSHLGGGHVALYGWAAVALKPVTSVLSCSCWAASVLRHCGCRCKIRCKRRCMCQ